MMTKRRFTFGRLIGLSYLTPHQIKEGRFIPLKKAEQIVARRRRAGHVVIEEPHDYYPWAFKKVEEIEVPTDVPGEIKRIRVEKKIWDIFRRT